MTFNDSKMGFVAVLLWASCARVASLRRGDGDDLADCNCDCCGTVRRLPEETVAGTKVKCAPAHDHGSDVCTDECRAPAEDRLLHIRGNVLDYQRFCFFECKPAEGPASPVSTQCIALSFEDIETTASHGQAKDPAIIYQAAQHKASLVVAKQPKLGPPSQDAKMSGLRGIKQAGFEGKEAFHEAKKTRGIEAETAQSMNEFLRHHLESDSEDPPKAFGAKDPFAGIHDIREMQVGASAAAEEAGEAAQAALEALKKARHLTWSNSVDAAQGVMEGVVSQADAKAKADAEMLKRISNTQEEKMAAAAAKAAEPFFLSMIRAQQTSKDYNARGEEAAGKARDLQAESEKIAKEANGDNAAGKVSVAQTKILDARKVMREAQAFAKQARRFFATAKEIDKGIPKFVAAAQAASAKAAYDTNPAWQR